MYILSKYFFAHQNYKTTKSEIQIFMPKNYHKKYSRKGKGFFFLLAALAIGVFVCFNIADIVSSLIIGKGSIFYNGGAYISSKTFYALSNGSFSSKDKAIERAGKVSAIGGAGYVYRSGDFYVFLSMYSSQIDANSVKDKLKEDGVEAKIVNINIPKLNLKFSDKDKNLSTLAKEFLKAFDYLYEMSINYDSGKVSYESCIISLKSKVAELEYAKALNPTTMEGIKVKQKALKMIELLKNLSQVPKNEYAFNSGIKYTYFEIVFDYIALCKSKS